jgi:S-(hydroxymethyl)glutathione dehydrogenase/alcohol dehydrogenase
MESKAVVCRSLDGLPGVEHIVVEPPRSREVLIKLSACGVCHSDLSVADGTIPMPRPIVLGHEGAGTIIATGPEVTELAVGDCVISSFVSVCGHCNYCRRGRHSLCEQAARTIATLPDGTVRTRDARGNTLNVFCGCGVMSEYATLHQAGRRPQRPRHHRILRGNHHVTF